MTSQTELHLRQSLHDIVSTQPFVPDVASIERRGRRLHRRATVGRTAAGIGVAAAVAAVAIGVNGTAGDSGHPSIGTTAPTVRVGATHAAVTNLPLIRLANAIKATKVHETGNATLVLRDQKYPNASPITGADLYTDKGEYFYSPTESGLPAQIQGNDNQGDGFMKRELAAAVYAASGSLQVARHRMAVAALDPGVAQKSVPRDAVIKALRAQLNHMTSAFERAALHRKIEMLAKAKPVSQSAITDNRIWESSLDALIAGADNSEVRAGVLRLLSTMSEVSVKNTTTDGQPSLTITAGAPALPTGYQEQLTINANTGLPIQFVGGNVGQVPGVTVSYKVSRVTVSEIEAGKY
jgi:hypothetical protein